VESVGVNSDLEERGIRLLPESRSEFRRMQWETTESTKLADFISLCFFNAYQEVLFEYLPDESIIYQNLREKL
jgi:hypothetical protein